jgi:hypothetical protein
LTHHLLSSRLITPQIIHLYDPYQPLQGEAFEKLIGAWCGILVSDDYVIYQKWVNKRQTCLAHLIRKACGLPQRKDPELSSW